MSRARKILDQFNTELMLNISPEKVKKALKDRMQALDISGVKVEEVEIDLDGNINVMFSDDEGFVDVVFQVDNEDEGVVALIVEDSDDDESEVEVIDLNPLNPTIVNTDFGPYVNLEEPNWLNRSAFVSILKAGEIFDDDTDQDAEDDEAGESDPYGYGFITLKDDEDAEKEEALIVESPSVNERKVAVIRGGKKVRLSVVRKRKKRRLSPKQKSGIKRAVRKRKQKKGQIQRKRKKSLKIRKRKGLKKKPKGFKIKRS